MTSTPTTCPACHKEFNARRSSQKFCSDNCRKLNYQKKERASKPRNAEYSVTKQYDQALFFDKAMRITEMYYTLRPDQRLGFIKELIDDARSGNTTLMQILTNLYLLSAGRDKLHLFWLGRYSCPNITKVANQYCRKFWKAGIKDVVMGISPEPETGECDISSDIGPAISTSQTVVTIFKGFLGSEEDIRSSATNITYVPCFRTGFPHGNFFKMTIKERGQNSHRPVQTAA